jgi:TonB family protein
VFEQIARTTPGNRRRRAGALVLSLMSVAGAASALVLSGNQLIEDAGELEWVELSFPVDFEAPGAPPPPPKGELDGGAVDDAQAPAPPEPEPPEPDAERPEDLDPADTPEAPQPPEAAPEGGDADALAMSDAPKGDPEGSADGEEGGVPGSHGTNLNAPPCQGVDCVGGPVPMHYSQVRFKVKTVPRFPRAAKELGLTSETCKVRVSVSTRGRPEQIEVLDCPAVFHDELLRAAQTWRFHPAEAGGEVIPAVTVIPVHFRLD